MSQLSAAESAVAEMLANRSPMAAEDYRAHVFATVIAPTVTGWGFDHRFVHELPMGAGQSHAYASMTDRMKCQGAIVALLGPRGLGKTSLAAQFAIRTAWRNHEESLKADGNRFRPHVIYKKLSALVSRYKSLYSDAGSIETETLMNSVDILCRQEFLVVDELHECTELKVKTRLLTDIVDRRYAACRDTVLIANQEPEEFVASEGDSIISRLSEHGAIIPCSWPSYRVKSEAA